MALIVNADDFGISEEVNKAISSCFNRQIIDRTTIMVNMPDAVKGIDIAEKNGFFDKVGLHINLTEGTPLTDSIKENALFCDENGRFNQVFYHNTKLRLMMNARSVYDVEQEIEAQIRLYRDFGFKLNHIDSHHHVHTNLPVLKAIENLSKVYSFSSIRLSRNLYRGGSIPNRMYKLYYNSRVKKSCKNTTDYFGSFDDLCSYFDFSKDNGLEKLTNFVNKHDVEVMVHPLMNGSEVIDDNMPIERERILYEAVRKM